MWLGTADGLYDNIHWPYMDTGFHATYKAHYRQMLQLSLSEAETKFLMNILNWREF